jgi:hypothetical protein
MFDQNKLHKVFVQALDQRRLIAGKVHYTNDGILSKIDKSAFILDLTATSSIDNYLAAITGHLNTWFPCLFLQKLIDWANEDEYRWVYLDVDPQPIFVNFKDALEAVIIGENVPDTYEESVLRYGVQYHADVASLDWHNGYPRIKAYWQPYITHKHLAT